MHLKMAFFHCQKCHYHFKKNMNHNSHIKESGLSIKIDDKEITLDDAKRLVKGIASGEINKDEVEKMFGNIMDDIDTIHRSKATKNRTRMLQVFKTLSKIFIKFSIGDKTNDDKAGDEEADEEQPATTNLPDLESEESVEQRRNQKGQGLKILTPDQTLSRLPISLA